jgi:Fe2+ transport system protein FeoA
MTRPASRPTIPLVRATAGQSWLVAATDPSIAAELAREGVLPGTSLTIVTRAPVGGPLVVAIGRARLAISADVAARVEVVREVEREAERMPEPTVDPAAMTLG